MNLTKLFIGNIPYEWDESDIANELSEATGQDFYIISLKKDNIGRSKGHAFVEVFPEYAGKVLALHGKQCGKMKLRVSLYENRS